MTPNLKTLALCWLVCGCDTFAAPSPSRSTTPTFDGTSVPRVTTAPPPMLATAPRAPLSSVPRAGSPGLSNRPVRDAGTAQFDDDASEPFGDELSAACTAALPTGYCIERSGSAQAVNDLRVSGTGATLTNYSPSDGSLRRVMLSLTSDGSLGGGSLWTFTIGTLDNEELAPGTYEPAIGGSSIGSKERAQLAVSGSASCFSQRGRFHIDEMATDAEGKLARLSLIFETRCMETGREAEVLRGAVHYQATGQADPAITFSKSIALGGDIFRVAYAAAANRVYGLDAKARKLTSIDLVSGQAKSSDVIQVPDAACVDEKRSRLVVANKGSSLISEYALDDLKLVREYSWSATDANPAGSHFQVYCASDKLYLVDAAAAPGLSVVENLAADPPTVVDHSAQVSSVGALAFKADNSEFYYWFQQASGGASESPLRRRAASDLSQLDQAPKQDNDPLLLGGLTSPLLLDETRHLLIAKTTVFDARDLSKRVYTLPDLSMLTNSFKEFAYALDTQHGWVATRRHVYKLESYEVVSRTASAAADQMFFDRDGQLWFLDLTKHTLRAQLVQER